MDIGSSVRRLRLKRGLTQAELADRCELSKSAISLIERNLTSPAIDTLTYILESLGTDLKTFFSESGDDKVVFTPQDMSDKEDPVIRRGMTRWLVPTAQKNAMEPILVEIGPGGGTSEDDPHEGEEFGYVLSGALKLEIGEKSYRVRRGDSFYFRADAPHRLVNTGKTACRVIWISSPPSF